jgi:elongation factor G
MDQFTTSQLRNVVLLGHSGSGKTSLGEAMLFATHAISRLGRVIESNTVSDFEPEEHKRQASMQLSVLPCVWRDTKINLLDTPGYADFVSETISALRVADAAVLVVSAVAGVEVGTEQMWQRARALGLPALVFVNKLDRENADFSRVLEQIRQQLGRQFVAVNIPVGSEAQFSDVVSLMEGDTTAQIQVAASQCHEQLTELVAETDDDLTEKYLESGGLSHEEIRRGMRQGVRSGQAVAVLAGCAVQEKGIEQLLDAIVDYLPSPDDRPAVTATTDGQSTELSPEAQGPLAALVFKTSADPFVGKLSYLRVYSGSLKGNSETWNTNKSESERLGQLFVVIGKSQETVPELVAGDIGSVAKLASTHTGDTLSLRANPLRLSTIEFPSGNYTVAVSPKNQADLDKMSIALSRIGEEDPTLRISREAATGDLLVTGMGDTHLDVMMERVKRKFGVELEQTPPRIAYRETIGKIANVEYRHKKQTGGHGQFGHVLLRLEPQDRGVGYKFANEVTGGNVPKEFIPSVEKGVAKALGEGGMGGYPIVDMKVVLYDGSSHSVDSSGSSFEIAGNMAVKRGMLEASPVLLEPVMRMHITVPEQFAGDVIGDLNTRRAKIAGMSPGGGNAAIEADVPQAEVLQYATTLRALTQGRGIFTVEFDHYGDVPQHLALKVVEGANR